MEKKDYLEWLFNWFSNRVEMPTDAVSCNFFTQGWIDSFKILELITEIESTFNIHFEDSAFNDSRFSTIQGLSEIIFELNNINQAIINS